MILSSSLRLNNRPLLFAFLFLVFTAVGGQLSLAAGLSLEPFGVISDLTQIDTPVKNFSEAEKVLYLSRVQKLPFEEKMGCDAVIKIFKAQTPGKLFDKTAKDPFEIWKPYSDKDRAAVEDCDSFPCAVKLDEKEVSKMKEAKKFSRLEVFFGLVSNRLKNYLDKNERKKYEFNTDPTDPFLTMLAKLKGDGANSMGTEKKIYSRIIDMKDSRARPIRQLLDERTSELKSGDLKMAFLVSRDIYSAHYFDSWGEWKAIVCDDKKHDLRLAQTYALELDLLKQTDLISVISRGSMKKNIRESADKLMDAFVSQFQAQLKPIATTGQ